MHLISEPLLKTFWVFSKERYYCSYLYSIFRMEGGSYLAEGRYGCVYKPSLNCIPNTKKTMQESKGETVGKLTTTDEANHELETYILLNTIPNANKYFVPIDSICEPDAKDEIAQCETLKDKKTSLVTMPYGGVTLAQLNSNNQRKIANNYMAYSQHLIEAGVLLLMKGLVHFDLHMSNIVIQEFPRIIDYGFIWTPKTLTNDNMGAVDRLYNPKLDQESPEASYCNGMQPPYNYKKTMLASDIINHKPIFHLIENIFGIPLGAQINIFTNFLNESQYIQNNKLTEFYKLYWTKFDAWAIGAVLTKILYTSIFDTSFVDTIYASNKKIIKTVLSGLLNPDPGLRYDCVEALQIWNPSSIVLKDPLVASWLSKQSAMRERAS